MPSSEQTAVNAPSGQTTQNTTASNASPQGPTVTGPTREPITAIIKRTSISYPGDVYLEMYLLVEDGQKYEASGDLKKALESYRKGKQHLDQLRSMHPEWRSEVRAYRRHSTEEAIARVEVALQEQR